MKILILIFFFLGEEARRENAVHRLLGEGIEEIVTAGITGEEIFWGKGNETNAHTLLD